MKFQFTRHAILRMSERGISVDEVVHAVPIEQRLFREKDSSMKCIICKEGVYRRGLATVVFTKGEAAVIIKAVPAQVCGQCGEYTLDAETTRSVLAMADEAFAKGTEVEIRRFAA